LFDDPARKQTKQLVIVSRQPGAWLDTEISRNHAAKRRTIRPRALKILKKWRIDLIEDLIAGPAEFDD
jgi:hypothetical protein